VSPRKNAAARRALAAGLLALAALARAAPARGQAPLMTDGELAAFTARLLPPTAAGEIEAALGPAAAALRAREHIDLGQLRLASLEAAECIMQRAADRRLSLAQLFTDARFAAGGGLGIVMDGRRLAELDRLFDLHSLFPVAADARAGGAIHMTFLLAGQGRIVVGYDRGGEIEHREPAFHLHGGSYQLERVIRMDVVAGAGRGFAHVATLPRLDGGGAYGDFLGPMGAKLRGVALAGPEVAVQAQLPWWLLGIAKDLHVRPPPVARRRPLDPTQAGVLRARGCPAGDAWAR
jgi:hypothetical protein